jgi:hypothetical protein
MPARGVLSDGLGRETVAIPPSVARQLEALEDALADDVFAPHRGDWRRGDDAYLRGT